MIDLNVRALVELTHAFWPQMLARKRGGVLNVASTSAFQPGPLMAVYYASKAFVLSFSEALWREAQDTGVKVSCLCPGRRRASSASAPALERRGSHRWDTMTSQSVAEEGYRGFQQNQRVVITGARNRLLARAVPFVPRRRILDLAYRLMSPI
jgi:short-subunit dehydrogenase